MNLRFFGKVIVAVAMVVCLLVALIYALESPDVEHLYKSLRGITYAIMALTFATAYRNFEY
jgi:hypothetical protein